jgi:hypothetical protein
MWQQLQNVSSDLCAGESMPPLPVIYSDINWTSERLLRDASLSPLFCSLCKTNTKCGAGESS